MTGSMRSLRIEIIHKTLACILPTKTGSMRSLRIEILLQKQMLLPAYDRLHAEPEDRNVCHANADVRRVLTGSMRSLRIEIVMSGNCKYALLDRLHAEPEDRNTHTNFLKKLAF